MFISYLFINYLFFLYINFLIYLFNSFWLNKYFKIKIKIEDNSKYLKHALRRFVENNHISLEFLFTLPVVNYNKLPLLKSNFTSAPYGIYSVYTYIRVLSWALRTIASKSTMHVFYINCAKYLLVGSLINAA